MDREYMGVIVYQYDCVPRLHLVLQRVLGDRIAGGQPRHIVVYQKK